MFNVNQLRYIFYFILLNFSIILAVTPPKMDNLKRKKS